MKLSKILSVFLGAALFCFLYTVYFSKPDLVTFNKNKTTIFLEIAKTTKEREIGLMYRQSMPQNHGMIFLFEQPQLLKFWMKNTLIPLDMIFLNHHRVAAIFANVQPCTSQNNDCPSYGPDTLADEVIELNAGKAKLLKILLNDKLNILHK